MLMSLSMMVKCTLLMCRPFRRRSRIEFVDISEAFTSIVKHLDGRALPCGVEGDLLCVKHASWNVAVCTITHLECSIFLTFGLMSWDVRKMKINSKFMKALGKV